MLISANIFDYKLFITQNVQPAENAYGWIQKKAAMWGAMYRSNLRAPYRLSPSDFANIANIFESQQINEDYLQERLDNLQKSLDSEKIKPAIQSFIEGVAKDGYGIEDLKLLP